MQCMICNGDFKTSPDSVVLCEHQKGFVHAGCCTHNCSIDGKPCVHCAGLYDRQE